MYLHSWNVLKLMCLHSWNTYAYTGTFLTQADGEKEARTACGGQKKLLHHVFIIYSFSAIKGNLIHLNCQWVNINILCVLMKFHKDLTMSIHHTWLGLVTEPKPPQTVWIYARMHLTSTGTPQFLLSAAKHSKNFYTNWSSWRIIFVPAYKTAWFKN